ncbi:MAG: hypothetical protein K6T85_05000 [Gorillibacterium sp.]|nr:hypothetical protein [Gorillibacterium sp.]
MNISKRLCALVVVVFMLLVMPGSLFAATTETAVTFKPTFERLVIGADSTLRLKITGQYNDLMALQNRGQSLETTTKTLQYKNEELLVGLRQQIKLIDAPRIERLKLEAEQARKRHKPLLDLYQSLNNQAETASSLGGKKIASALRKQAGLMKIPVQLAREDIKAKDAALKAAKDKVTQTAKKVRATLSDIDTHKVKIKAVRSAATSIRTSYSAVWNTFKAAVKKNEAQAAASTLSTLITLSRNQADNLQLQYNLEVKISDTLALAKKQIP